MEPISISGYVAVQVNSGEPVGYWSTIKRKFFGDVAELRMREILMTQDECAENLPDVTNLGKNVEVKIAKVTIEIN